MSQQREAFNFYRSYYDVYKLLSKKDREEFMTALLEKQFEGKEPNHLSGQSLFAYTSQQHSINKQVKGWEDKKGVKLSTLAKGGSQGGSNTPTEQVQEKGEEKERIDFDYDQYLKFINDTLGRQLRVVCDKTKKEIPKRLKEGYTKKQIQNAIVNVKNVQNHIDSNYRHCTPEFFSRAKTLQQYSDEPKTGSNTYQLID